jgi:hypothetical protein
MLEETTSERSQTIISVLLRKAVSPKLRMYLGLAGRKAPERWGTRKVTSNQ